MPSSNSLAQSVSQSKSTEQKGFLPVSPAQFCPCNAKVSRPKHAHARKSRMVLLPGVLPQRGEQMGKSAKSGYTEELLHWAAHCLFEKMTFQKSFLLKSLASHRFTSEVNVGKRIWGEQQVWSSTFVLGKANLQQNRSLKSQFAAVKNKHRAIQVTVSPILLMILVMKSRWLLTSVIWHRR